MAWTAGTLFFAADDGVHGVELWRTDGTDAGTYLVRDIHPGPEGSIRLSAFVDRPRTVEAIEGVLYFLADDGVHGFELWRSDGTEAGTTLVADLRPGAQGAEIDYLVSMAGDLYFAATDANFNREIWRSDGTAAGTRVLADLHARSESGPYYLTDVGDRLYFFAFADAGTGLWSSDGSAEGTALVAEADLAQPNRESRFARLGDRLILSVRTRTDGRATGALWAYDTAAAEIDVLRNFETPPNTMTTTGGQVFFGAASEATQGIAMELWATDGTPAGTLRLTGLNSGGGEFYTGEGAASGDRFFFVANDYNAPPPAPQGSNQELWVSDGTPDGTTLVQDLFPAAQSSPRELTASNGAVYFAAITCATTFCDDPDARAPLWLSDGSSAGTVELDMYPDSGPNFLLDADGVLYFESFEPGTGSELYKVVNSDAERRVEIDIKPATNSNCLHIDGKGAVPVAVLGATDLDVAAIDIHSLRFEGLKVGTTRSGRLQCRKKFVNGDGLLDLACFYEDDLERWTGAEPEGRLAGRLSDGTQFRGSDRLCLVD
ncbi:hypothetical protein ABI59_17825 [Acidobacteria bacterium Mor1]|nr:hypothetical protein ABI59_17825 [Acidobacteria bacterium Mor1]